ncbi:hypothetical protein nbrc107696_20280 [Gordonia spumicola]|uniref:DUF6802 domain-containing protein n=1 Tax=Gordonia spumicola TaxID=589161 RepID=A0A7I9V8L6_9ACTN|nr:DUF6802 family protein [Gordonia spumicola]GEE01582.1 hypothetical protein nbrc107696_20280 [Gordonia spumicola]
MDDWFDARSDDAGTDPADSLWIYDDGALWDLGPADFDSDGDGVAESLTAEFDGGHAVLTDTDGDGRVDRITTLHADGSTEVADGRSEPLRWSPTSLGRLE